MGLIDKVIKGGAVAILGFVVLFLLGAIPFAPNPNAAVIKAIDVHNENVLASMKLLRAICYRLPDNPRFPCE